MWEGVCGCIPLVSLVIDICSMLSLPHTDVGSGYCCPFFTRIALNGVNRASVLLQERRWSKRMRLRLL